MENFDETKPFVSDNDDVTLIVTEDIRSYIYETSKWAKFLSIIGFIICAFLALFALIVPSILAALTAFSSGAVFARLGAGFLTGFYLFGALLHFYPSLLLFKYSNLAKKAVLYGDQLSLSAALSKMKSFFKFWGILTIVIIALYILMIVVFVASGGQAAA